MCSYSCRPFSLLFRVQPLWHSRLLFIDGTEGRTDCKSVSDAKVLAYCSGYFVNNFNVSSSNSFAHVNES